MASHVSTNFYDPHRRNAIGWCSCTHNFFRGCTRVSPGCDHCYAIAEALHQQVLRPAGPYRGLTVLRRGLTDWSGVVRPTGEDAWTQPFREPRPMLAFIDSMSDAFHHRIPDAWLELLINVLHRASWHTWQLLTKRPERMADVLSRLRSEHDRLVLRRAAKPFVLQNLWLGTSIESQEFVDDRLSALVRTPAAVRFVSIEPMLGPVDVRRYLQKLDWVIVGGESEKSGSFRDLDLDWVREVRNLCVSAGVAFFFKQRAGRLPWMLSKDLDGREWRQLPRRGRAPVTARAERRSHIEWVRREYGALPKF